MVETVGWTQGSLHNKVEKQPLWKAKLLDVSAVLALLSITVLAAVAAILVAAAMFIIRKLRRHETQTVKKQL